MAGTDRTATDSLIESLSENPYEYDFFQLLRKLQALYPDNPRIGESIRLSQDWIRLRQEVSLAFASSTIKRVEKDEETGILNIFNQFFGLWGANGPMPHDVTQYILDQKRDYDDSTLANFADIFHHRLLSFFFKAWADAQKTVDYDRPEDAQFPRFINSFFGAGMEGFRTRDSIPDAAKTYYSGHLSSATQHQSGLQAILEDFFGIKTQIKPFVGHWMTLPEDCCHHLDESESNGFLGQNTILGDTVWDCQLKFRVVMGPMGKEDYERILPGGKSYQMLKDWVNLYTDQVMLWDLQLILKAEAAKPIVLGESGNLGWGTWLMTESLKEDSEDLIVDPELF
jgi:type VI secretion system protein ImpH